jgi:hypothetical protein
MGKSKPLKLPKQIGGIKVPKFLREPGTIEGILDSPVGRAVLAEAPIAAAAALKNYKPTADTGEAVEAAANGGSDAAKDPVQSAASGSADVTVGVIRQIVPAASGDESGADKPAKRAKPKQSRPDEAPSRH